MLMRHAVMLRSNFALSITLDGHLSSVPDLLHGLPPDPARLPNTLLQISTSLAAGETQQHCVIAQVQYLCFYSVTGCDRAVICQVCKQHVCHALNSLFFCTGSCRAIQCKTCEL